MLSFNHFFRIPSPVFEGRGCSKILPLRLVESGVKRVVLVMDSNVQKTPWGESLKREIAGHIDYVEVWSNVKPNTPSHIVEMLAYKLHEICPEAIVAVGGGSTIDLAKAGVAVYLTGLSIHDLLSGKWVAASKITSLYAIPTTCGSGSEGSPFAVVLLEEERIKRGFRQEALVPKEVYLDSEALTSLPDDYVAATGIDACCHAIETYLSIKSSSFNDCSVLGAALSAFTNISVASQGNIAARAALLAASFSSRLMSSGVGLSIAHAISHPLGARTGLHHGKAVALGIIPSLRMNLPYAQKKIATLARHMLPSCPTKTYDAAEAFIDHFETLLRNLPLKIPAMKLDNEEMRHIAELSLQSSNIASNPAPLDIRTTFRLVSEAIAWSQ